MSASRASRPSTTSARASATRCLPEKGHALPGMLIVGSDSHTPSYGALGAFAAGIGRTEAAAVMATGEIWLRVPESMRIVVDGQLPDAGLGQGPGAAHHRRHRRRRRRLPLGRVCRAGHRGDERRRPAGAVQHGRRDGRQERLRRARRGDAGLAGRPDHAAYTESPARPGCRLCPGASLRRGRAGAPGGQAAPRGQRRAGDGGGRHARSTRP